MSSDDRLVGRPFPVPVRSIPLRSLTISRADLIELGRRLQETVQEFGKAELAGLNKPDDLDEEQWAGEKNQLLDRAFQTTVRVTGEDDRAVFVPRVEHLEEALTGRLIKSVYLTNKQSYESAANRFPTNQFEIFLDFSPSIVLDADNPVSSPTPNRSSLNVQSIGEAWASAVEDIALRVFKRRRRLRGIIHAPFSYDFSLAIIGMPLAFATLFIADPFISGLMPSPSVVLVVGVYAYLFFVLLWLYRALFGYLRWLFPTVELVDQKTAQHTHRRLGLWLFGGLALAGLSSLFF